MSKFNAWLWLFLACVLLYLCFHLGRWYESRQVSLKLDRAYSMSSDTYYFPYGEFKPNVVLDELATGICFPERAMEIIDSL